MVSRSAAVNGLRKFPVLGTTLAMMLDPELDWWYRIPAVNYLMYVYFQEDQSYEQMTAKQEFYGVTFALLFMVPLGFLGAVEYDELDDVITRAEDYACDDYADGMKLAAKSSLAFHSVLGSLLFLGGLISVVILEPLIKAFAVDDGVEKGGILPEEGIKAYKSSTKTVQRWVSVVNLAQIIIFIVGLLMIINGMYDIVLIKFPDYELDEDDCTGRMVFDSPYGFTGKGKTVIIYCAVCFFGLIASGVTYEFQKNQMLNNNH